MQNTLQSERPHTDSLTALLGEPAAAARLAEQPVDPPVQGPVAATPALITLSVTVRC